MLRSSIRKFNAMFLVLAVWVSALAFFPISMAAQTAPDKKDTSTQQVKATANKPLSDKEDPSKIGTRNINGGSDKFFGWLGGSKEKEAQIGAQLSREVEQQAKIIEDPLVTEYINRV